MLKMWMLFLGFMVISTTGIADEIVTNQKGQKIVLKDDKTWEIVQEQILASTNIKYADEAVEVWDKSLELTEVNYSKSVALHLHYKNNTDKKVVGVTVTVRIANPFGKNVFENTINDEVVVAPLERMKNNTYWHFDDNPFIGDQPYDRLWMMAQNGTAKIDTKVQKVIFEDGSVLEAKSGGKSGSKKKSR